MNFIKLLKSKKTVFTINDIKKIFSSDNENTIRDYLSKAKKKWLVENVYYGIWKLVDKDIDFFEFATKLKKKSYISFETVLQKEWIIFQDYSNSVFLASDNTITKYAVWKNFISLKIIDWILLNPLWVENRWNYSIASKERAICDRIYLSSNYFFDNLGGINLDNLEEISQIYNKRTILEIKKIINNVKTK